MNPTTPHRSISPHRLYIFFLAFVFLLSSCVHEPLTVGSVLFSSNQNCLVRVFNTDGKELFRLDVPHDSTVSADMTSKGIFVVHAVSSGGVVHKQTLLFEGGVVDCFIFFR